MSTTEPRVETTSRTARHTPKKVETPEQALIRVDQHDHELVEAEDWAAVVEQWPIGTLKLAAIRWCQRDHRRVLSPEPPQRAAPATGDRPLQAFVDQLWAHYRKMTGAQARAEAGLLVSIFATVGPRQIVEKAMTRQQFSQRFGARR